MDNLTQDKRDDRMIETTMESKSSVAMLKILGQKLFDTMGVKGKVATLQPMQSTKISAKKQLPGFEKERVHNIHQNM